MTKIRIDDRRSGIFPQWQLGCDSAERAIEEAIVAADDALGKINNEEVYRRPIATGEAKCADCGLCFGVNVATSGEPTQMSSALIDHWSEEVEHFVTVCPGRPRVTSVKMPGDFMEVCIHHKES